MLIPNSIKSTDLSQQKKPTLFSYSCYLRQTMPLSQYTHVLTQWKIHRRAIKEEIVNTLTDMIEQANVTSAVKQGLSFKV